MDFTIMITFRQYGTSASGYALTSQLKTFPTRELAELVAEKIRGGDIQVIKLYL